MKILILEDDEIRKELFRSKLLNHELYITDNVEEFKKLLMGSKFDVLFLDHDLDGESYVPTDSTNTGSEAARWLDQNREYIPDIIFLHTLNIVGRINMKWLLPKAIFAPYVWLRLKEDIESLIKQAQNRNGALS